MSSQTTDHTRELAEAELAATFASLLSDPRTRRFFEMVHRGVVACPPGKMFVLDYDNRFIGHVGRDEADAYAAQAEADPERMLFVLPPEAAAKLGKHVYPDTDWKTVSVGQLGEPYKRNHYGALQTRWWDGQEEVRTVPMGWHRSRAGAYEYAKEQGLLK